MANFKVVPETKYHVRTNNYSNETVKTFDKECEAIVFAASLNLAYEAGVSAGTTAERNAKKVV
jgi:hypothetical protein